MKGVFVLFKSVSVCFSVWNIVIYITCLRERAFVTHCK